MFYFLAFLLALMPVPAFAQEKAAYEADLHVIEERTRAEWRAVGRVQRGTDPSPRFCTGTLVAPDLVLTAAHCTGAAPGNGEGDGPGLVFAAGWERGNLAALRKIDAIVRHPFYLLNAGVRFRHDLALLHLAEPITDIAPLPADRPDEAEQDFSYVGYNHGQPEVLTGDFTCPKRAAGSGMLSVGCTVKSGHSGSPLLARRGDAWTITGVLVARNGETGAIAAQVNGWVMDMIHELSRAAAE